jgi:hypothetical protein
MRFADKPWSAAGSELALTQPSKIPEEAMLKLTTLVKKTLVVSLTMVLMNAPATAVFADDPPPCTPPDSSAAGVHWPTGSDAGTFTYQCDGPYAGDWTNDYYVFYPDTVTRAAIYDPGYFYDCDANQWYMTSWDFSAADGTYHNDTIKTANPGLATGCPVAATDPGTTGGSGPTTNAAIANPNTPISSGGSGITLNGTNNTLVNNGTTAVMSNGLLSISSSGNAGVIGNTTGGSATSGGAVTVANVINLLQSSSNVLGDPNLLTFTANINGDVNGDLLLDPAQLSAVQPANVSTSLDNNVTINSSTDAAINNNITLGANSGNADVSGNTSGGSATSGTADAVANIVNILNSAVTAGRSFVGVININGNLNGDILLPPNFVDTLLASNVPHYTVNTANLTSNTTVNNTNNQTINNNVNLGAQSGDANVSGNTTGGSATSGLANTNLTVFNLTGSTVVASNDILVFVNVLGSWYGMIMNAPAGTTAASLGSGVSSSTTVNDNATLNNTNNQAINNNVNVNAQSGDANVTNNTKGGDATSGDATASANIVNMINDSLSLNGWFGLLFINVFGTWNGSFGINTSAGDPVVTSNSGKGGDGSAPMFRFISATPGGSNSSATYSTGGSGSGSSSDGVVLAASAVQKAAASLPSTDGISAAQKATNNFLLPIGGAVLAFLIIFASERKRFFSRT